MKRLGEEGREEGKEEGKEEEETAPGRFGGASASESATHAARSTARRARRGDNMSPRRPPPSARREGTGRRAALGATTARARVEK